MLDFDKNASLFAVYDGHGGAEVALYCAQNLPKFLKIHEEYKKGNYERALQLAFIDFDGTLVQEAVIEELKKLVPTDKAGDSETEDEDDDEDLAELCQESDMPLEQLIEKYKENRGGASAVAKVKASEASGSKPISPNLRGRRAQRSADAAKNGEGSSGSAGGSSSSSKVTSSKVEEGTSSAESKANVVEEPSTAEAPESTSSEIKEVVTNGDSTSKSPDTTISNNSTDKETVSPAGSASTASVATPPSGETKEKKVIAEDDDTSSSDEEDASYNIGNGDGVAADSDDDDDEGEEEEDEDEDDEDDDEDDSDDELYPEEEEDDSFLNSMLEAPGTSSGCTAVVALLVDRELFVANAGDSRCVVCRDGQAVEMSLDHKPEDTEELERIKKAGGRVTMDGRVNGGLNLSRAIGDHGYKMNKALKPEEQMISAKPDIKHITVSPTDEFMVIACDGIWNFMTSEEVVQFVKVRLNDGREKLSTICEEVSKRIIHLYS